MAHWGFPGGPSIKNPPTSAGDAKKRRVPSLSHGRAHDESLQYSCLEKPMVGGPWWATVHRVTKR